MYIEIRHNTIMMYAEGSSDQKPKIDDIILAIKKRGYVASNIERWFDDMQGFWRFTANIKRVKYD